jgi:DNA invertase Pin-like site-specific DNA recombinase
MSSVQTKSPAISSGSRVNLNARSNKPAAQTPRDTSTTALSTKVKRHHTDRLAIVYVRQSTQKQVLENTESTARQYALVERAKALGWSADRIEVIDDDLGQSGSSIIHRGGFQRLLTEVSGDAVGLVLGLEMSRLARSCKDWHVLLELCGIYQTLLADSDGTYDPGDHNDRLLLGLKGTMSEAELHVLRSRMYAGLCNKAERGEVINHAPIGYVRTPGGDFIIDSDAQVQATVKTIFDRFRRWGSISGLLKSLVRDEIKMPVRPHYGPERSELQWRKPNRVTLLNMLHAPIYAGAYRWGHRDVDRKKKIPGRPGTGRTLRSHEDCRVLIRDRFEAYIDWSQFEENQQKLRENSMRGRFRAAPGRGVSLLAGLVQCGRCGRSMNTTYSCGHLRYSCQRGALDYGEDTCQSLAGRELDQAVGRLLLEALQPASITLSLNAINDVQRERDRAATDWQHRLQRVAFECERARRQYAAAEPEYRLVVADLERRWNDKLVEQESLQREYRLFEQSQPKILTAEERSQIERLSRDIPALWHHQLTSPEDRQTIARILLDRVVLTVEGDSEIVDVELRFAGGFISRLTHRRPVQSYDHRSDFVAMMQRIEQLQSDGRTASEIAAQLNADGFAPAKRAKQFSGAMVSKLVARQATLAGTSIARKLSASATDEDPLHEHEWLLSDLAAHLQMPVETMHRWRKVGWVTARKLPDSHGRWALFADEKELLRLRELRAYRRGWGEQKTPTRLTTPTTNSR